MDNIINTNNFNRVRTLRCAKGLTDIGCSYIHHLQTEYIKYLTGSEFVLKRRKKIGEIFSGKLA
jgi:hypothetical protein